MDWMTCVRAKTIVNRGEVFLVEQSPGTVHFKVLQRSGEWADVVWRIDKGWNCNALAKNKKWSCTLFKGERKNPYCSHSLASKILMERLKEAEHEQANSTSAISASESSSGDL